MRLAARLLCAAAASALSANMAGAQAPSSELDPNAPLDAMPDLGVRPEDARDIAAWLYTRR